jgi:hypothetical protein
MKKITKGLSIKTIAALFSRLPTSKVTQLSWIVLPYSPFLSEGSFLKVVKVHFVTPHDNYYGVYIYTYMYTQLYTISNLHQAKPYLHMII